jgi:transposase
MPETISRDIKHEALIMIAHGIKIDQAAENLGISERTIWRAIRREQKYGDIEGGKRKPGRKAKIDVNMEEVLHIFHLKSSLTRSGLYDMSLKTLPSISGSLPQTSTRYIRV